MTKAIEFSRRNDVGLRARTRSCPYLGIYRWRYTGRFATTIFSAVQPCNVGTMLQPFQAMSQQCCNAVLRKKSCLPIVPCNIILNVSRATLHNTRPSPPRASEWPIKQHQSALKSRATYLTQAIWNHAEIAPKTCMCKPGLKTVGYYFLLFSGKKRRGGSVGTKERFWITFG